MKFELPKINKMNLKWLKTKIYFKLKKDILG
jgi:hypothetical protein